jgi:MiaB/RimO family radical SAM methylthiotransferase
MRNFYLVGGNCPRSRQDAQTIINYFKINDLEHVTSIKKADLICIYSCGGFNTSEQLSLQTIQNIIDQKSDHTKVILTGCLVKINPTIIEKFPSLIVIKYDEFSKVDEIIHAKKKFNEIPDAGIINKLPKLGERTPIKKMLSEMKNNPLLLSEYFNNYINRRKEYDERFYHIRITRGCLCNCSYCAIKISRGHLKSKPLSQIKMEIEEGVRKGFKRFVLVGEDTGCYGLDIDSNVIELLQLFFDNKEIKKLMINDFNPQWLIKYYDRLEPLFITHQSRIQDLRIPIQSGSNNILKKMRRPYNIEDVEKNIIKLKEKIPNLKIYTHIIVGFPGETEDDFQKSIELLNQIDFYDVRIFSYEDRSMTDSAKMEDKITKNIIQERVNKIKKYM